MLSTYTLKIEGLNLFLSDKQRLSGCNLTKNKKNAMLFSQFDNPEVKKSIWDAAIQLQCNSSAIKFETICL